MSSKEEDVVCEEVALEEFGRFIEEMDLDYDESKMDEDDARGFDKLRKIFVRAMMRGKLSLNDHYEPVYHYKPDNAEPIDILFPEARGKTYLALDRGKKDHDAQKFMLVMADLTKQEPKIFSDMRKRDYKVCQAVTQLFLS